ncbi:MAG: ComF family protein [Gemmatimonadetes bacterium]|nr:ComF family protein [Gemmatimonadota bacterium]
MVRSILAAARQTLLDVEALLLPVACLGCERPLPPTEERGGCCALCRYRMRPIAPPVCARCGQPVDRWDTATGRRAGAPVRREGPVEPGPAAARRGNCAWCRSWPAELGWAASAVWLEPGAARHLVHALKYGGWQCAAVPMAELMVRECGASLRAVDVLVPIPLGRVRERERGHNQAAELALALGALTGIPVEREALVRSRETRTQTALAPAERWRNLAGAFRATGPLGARRVALVDDVTTTGATLASAAAALASAEPGIIGAVTFARASVPA